MQVQLHYVQISHHHFVNNERTESKVISRHGPVLLHHLFVNNEDDAGSLAL